MTENDGTMLIYFVAAPTVTTPATTAPSITSAPATTAAVGTIGHWDQVRDESWSHVHHVQ